MELHNYLSVERISVYRPALKSGVRFKWPDSLDEEDKDRLLKRWEAELADFSSAFIGRSVGEWLHGTVRLLAV
jgi:hypothetical protein